MDRHRVAKRLYDQRMRSSYPSVLLSAERRQQLPTEINVLVDAANAKGVKIARREICEKCGIGYGQAIKYTSGIVGLQHAVRDNDTLRNVLNYYKLNPNASKSNIAKANKTSVVMVKRILRGQNAKEKPIVPDMMINSDVKLES